MMCGGFTNSRPADDNVKAIALEMKPKVEEALGTTYTQFEAVSFTTHVVAGTNYKIKVKVGDENYVHIKVFVPLPCNSTEKKLMSQEAGKTLNDAL